METQIEKPKHVRKPDWLKVDLRKPKNINKVDGLVSGLKLHTVCEEAACPNLRECYSKKTATFMILGDTCTRHCKYCNIAAGKPLPVDHDEPANLAFAAKDLGLKHVVITAVARDDIKDGGAAHWVRCIDALHRELPDSSVEVLIPDFKGKIESLQLVLDAKPDVLNHNIETVRRIFPTIRAQGRYDRTMELLKRVKEIDSKMLTKSGFMVGIGETDEEVFETLRDLKAVDTDFITIGQYLQPSKKHMPVTSYVHPDKFNEYKEYAYSLGFKHVASAPLVRSSYDAKTAIDLIRKNS